MAEISRRTFLVRTGAGAASAGVLAAIPLLATSADSAERPERVVSPAPRTLTPHSEPLVVHIPDPSKDEVRYMVGTHEVVHHDRALVARLVSNAG